MQTVARLFDPAPETWGLRGDAPLWETMQAALAETPLPDDAGAMRELLARAFEACTGAPLEGQEDAVFVPELARGGMSSGHVSRWFWREEGLPLLLARFGAARK